LSDAGSSCSSSAMPFGCGIKLRLGHASGTASMSGESTTSQGLGFGSRRRRPIPRGLCLGSGGHFGGTPLEPIPQTPEPLSPQKRKAKAIGAQRSFNTNCESQAMLPFFQPPPGLLPPGDLCLTRPETAPPGLSLSEDFFQTRPGTAPSGVFAYAPPPQRTKVERGLEAAMMASSSVPVLDSSGAFTVSSKQGVRDRMMARAKKDAMPLKVTLPELAGSCYFKHLDPTMPVKKKPLFAEPSGATAALAFCKMEPNLPVKKRVSAFLLMDSPHVLPTQMQPR